MFFTKLHSAVSTELEDAEKDYKQAKRIGQYRFSQRAVYMADGTYVPFESVTAVTADRTSVHVSGCCAGGVPVQRLVLTAEDKKIQLLFDFEREISKALEALGSTASDCRG